MGLLLNQARSICNSWQPQTISELDSLILGGGGRMTSAGVPVSEQSALSLIEVQKCVNVLARTRGCLETKVYRWADTARRKKEEAYAHPLYELLAVAPNDETDAQSYIETDQLFLSLWGNSTAEITRNSSRNKNITEIYQWQWWDVRPKRNESGKLYYEHRDRGKWEKYPAEKVFHINTMSWDGVIGLSTIGTAREMVANGMAMQDFANRFFGNGMNVGSTFETDNALSPTARKNLTDAVKEAGQGLGKSWEPLLLEEGVKWKRIPMSFVDAEFVAMMKLTTLNVDGLFGVPPPMVGNSFEGLTYTNIEQMPLYYVLFTLLPIVTRFERMANWKLLTPQDREAGYFVKTNLKTLLRADAKTRAEYFKQKIQNGAANPNDWRADDDENPNEDPSGDEYYMNGNTRTIKQICATDIKSTTGTGGNPDQTEDDNQQERRSNLE